MKSHFSLLQINLQFQDYKFAILCFITAFVVTMLCIPVIIKLAKKFSLSSTLYNLKLDDVNR